MNTLCNAMFPQVDDFLLDYNYDDGERCEPLYYVPVLPVAIMETFSIPATGWKTNICARDWEQVIWNVRKLIAGSCCNGSDVYVKLDEMAHWTPNNECEVIEDQSTGKILIIGSYSVDKKNPNKIHINEMPPSLWHGPWQEKFKDDPNIESILNNSTGNIIDIDVTFKPGAIAGLKPGIGNLDAITSYLKLYEQDTAAINVIGTDTSVISTHDSGSNSGLVYCRKNV